MKTIILTIKILDEKIYEEELITMNRKYKWKNNIVLICS